MLHVFFLVWNLQSHQSSDAIAIVAARVSGWREVTSVLVVECVSYSTFTAVQPCRTLVAPNSSSDFWNCVVFCFFLLFMLILPLVYFFFRFLVAPHFANTPGRRSLLLSPPLLSFLSFFHVTRPHHRWNSRSLLPHILLMNLAISHLSDADYNLLIPCCRCRVMRLFFGPGVRHRMWGYIRDGEVRDGSPVVPHGRPL